MSQWRRLAWISTVATLAACPLGASAAEVFPLPPHGVERVLPRGAIHAYLLDLRTGEYVHLKAEQLGVDLELRLLDPAGKPLLRIDSPTGKWESEEIFFIAASPGRYQAQIAAWDDESGRYRMALAARRTATPEDRRRAAALAAFCRGRELDGPAATAGQAAAFYRQAAGLFRERGEPAFWVEARRRWAKLLVEKQHSPGEALPLFQEILAMQRRSGSRRGQTLMQTEIARCHLDLKDFASAEAASRQALTAWRQMEDAGGIINSLHTLGESLLQEKSFPAALGFFEEELERAGDPETRARALISLGETLSAAGDDAAAVARFREALAQSRDAGRRAKALTQLGNALAEEGATFDAVAALTRAWFLLRKSAGANRRDQVAVLVGLGKIYFKTHDFARAEWFHRRALQLLEEADGGVNAAYIGSNLGWIAAAQRRFREARDEFQKALSLARARHLRDLEAAVLLGLAYAERQRGNPIDSRAHVEEALAIIEEIRGELVRPDLQIAFFAKKEDCYGFMIDLLMQQRQTQSGSDSDLRAFVVSEQSRSRALLDSISRNAPGATAAPLSIAEVRRLLDDDTLLLEYYLGEKKSYLWVVSSTSVTSFELKRREVIERQARQALAALAKRATSPLVVKARLRELGDSLLGRVRGLLGTKRLVFIPHGALQVIPFAVLSDPDKGIPDQWSPLLLRHETVVLPSASVLAAVRRRAAARRPSPGGLALIGDAVISADDPLLPPAARNAAGPLEGGPLEPLLFVKEETAAILALAPPRKVLQLLGFRANREEVIRGGLGDYDILHFVTHGIFDEARPEQPALVLSRFDPAGGLRRGLLFAQDIEKMRLNAGLAVLSACETARGREVRGEGVIGLTRSFLAAGADRVLVSLWKVDDRATAILMERFYQSLFGKGRTPAAAWREAQLSMWKEERPPYQWAGFLLYGDWD